MGIKNLKALVSLVLVLALCGTILGTAGINVAYASELEPVFCTATLEDDFSDNDVLVCVFPEWNETTYTPMSFQSIGCISVDEIFTPRQHETPSRILHLKLSKKSKQNVLDSIQILQKREDVYCAGPNYLNEVCAEPNDPRYISGEQWAAEKMDLPAAWNITTGSSTIKVGIIDSGIDANHPDLTACVNRELSRSFSPQYNDPLDDDFGHGTHIAGIVGAKGNNGVGVSGVCWNVQLVSLRVDYINEDNKFVFSSAGTVSAIEYAEEHGIPILNYSAGSQDYDGNLETAIANYSGLFVCAACNSESNNDSIPAYPANYDLENIISVGASTETDGKRSTSNWGRATVDIFAPGQNILSTAPGGGYVLKSGTSMAAPQVAGAAALLLAKYPEMSAAQLKNAIMEHAEIVFDSNGNSVFGNLCVSGGRLNIYNLLHHNPAYIAGTSIEYHSCRCSICNYDLGTEQHSWVSITNGYRCTKCRKVSSIIPANPSWLANNITAMRTRTMIEQNQDNVVILIEEGTYLCYNNGKYYFVKADTPDNALHMLNEYICHYRD